MTFPVYVSIGFGLAIILTFFIGRSETWKIAEYPERFLFSIYIASAIPLWPIVGCISAVWGLLSLFERRS